MGIEENHANLFPADEARVDSPEGKKAAVKKNQERTDKKTVEKTGSLKIRADATSAGRSLEEKQIVVQQLPKSLALVPRLSPNPSLARHECLKAAEKLKPGRFMLFCDITNRCLAVQTASSKFKYTPNVEATFKGPVQNVATSKWTLSKRDLTLDEVIMQFGGMCDLISLERLPLASPSKIEDAQNIQPGQFILLRNKDQSVLAVKKTLEGAIQQTCYEHDFFAGTFIQKQRGGAKEFTNRVSLSEIVREQGGVQNLCLNKLVSQGPSLQEPQPVKVRDLPHWSVLTWDTFLGDFKAGEFVLFRNLKDDSVVVCMNRGEKGAKVDPVFHTLSTVVVNGKETYVDANKKTYNSLKELIAHLGGSDRLRYDKLYSSINEQKSNYDLVEG